MSPPHAPQNQDPGTRPAIDSVIHTIRGERVILDADLAKIYGVATKVFNQAVKRNREKFPPDFILQITTQELLALNRSQIVTGSWSGSWSCGAWGGVNSLRFRREIWQ